jgi:hypothetical protein
MAAARSTPRPGRDRSGPGWCIAAALLRRCSLYCFDRYAGIRRPRVSAMSETVRTAARLAARLLRRAANALDAAAKTQTWVMKHPRRDMVDTRRAPLRRSVPALA